MTMMLTTYLASLSPLALLRSLPGACAQGLIWGLLALGAVSYTHLTLPTKLEV